MKFGLKLQRSSGVDLSQQIYEQLKSQILSGVLKPGLRITSSRMLAHELDVSRPTVAAAFEQLIKEGYLETRHGSGTFVQSELTTATKKRTAKSIPATKKGTLSEFHKTAQIHGGRASSAQGAAAIVFQFGKPELEHFPHELWSRLHGRITRTSSKADLTYAGNASGLPELKKAIAEMLLRLRGMVVQPEQVIIVTGLHHGLDLAARLHTTPGSTVVMEDPCYHLAADIFKANSAVISHHPIDSQGLILSGLNTSRKDQSRLFYLTPSHQFPSGVTMSLPRRLALLEYARRTGSVILEDDFDSEYHAQGKPLPSLMSLDKEGLVIYSGTFNQLLYPTIGIGYLVVPPKLVPLYEGARQLTGEAINSQLQKTLATFIQTGELDRHWKRTRSIYTERREVLLTSLQKHFKKACAVQGEQCGLFMTVKIDSPLTTREIVKRASGKGVGIHATNDFYAKKPDAKANEFILGFGALPPSKIKEGIKRLASAISRD